MLHSRDFVVWALCVVLSSGVARGQSQDISWLQAFRFANRTTFGPKRAEIAQVQRDGFEAWLETQFRAAPSRYPEYLNSRTMEWSQFHFFDMAMHNNDQLRQRVAFAGCAT